MGCCVSRGRPSVFDLEALADQLHRLADFRAVADDDRAGKKILDSVQGDNPSRFNFKGVTQFFFDARFVVPSTVTARLLKNIIGESLQSVIDRALLGVGGAKRAADFHGASSRP